MLRVSKVLYGHCLYRGPFLLPGEMQGKAKWSDRQAGLLRQEGGKAAGWLLGWPKPPQALKAHLQLLCAHPSTAAGWELWHRKARLCTAEVGKDAFHG